MARPYHGEVIAFEHHRGVRMRRVMVSLNVAGVIVLIGLGLVTLLTWHVYLRGDRAVLAVGEARFWRAYFELFRSTLSWRLDDEALLTDLARHLAAMPSSQRYAVRLGAWLIDLSPIIMGGRLSRFCRLPPDDRRAHLSRIEAQRLTLLPGALEGFQALALLIIGGQADTYAAVGFARQQIVSDRRAARLAAGGDPL